MDRSKILYLITLEAMGSTNKEDASELLQAMQTEKDFPWKEMGEYQNLAAMISMVVNQESPTKNLEVRIFSEIEKIEKMKTKEVLNPAPIKNQQKIIKSKEEEELLENNNIPDELLEQNHSKETGLKIVDHSSEFEEVKSKLFKIKDTENKAVVTQPDFQVLEEEHIEEIPIVKNPKPKKSKIRVFRRSILIAASTAILIIAVTGFIYFNIFDNDIEEQKLLAEKETEVIISKSRVIPNENQSIVTVENIEQVETENIQPEQIQLPIEENNEPEVLPEIIEPKKEKELLKPVFPPPQTPEFIEAQLIVENEQNNPELNDNLITSTFSEKQLPPKEIQIVDEEPVYFVAVEEMPEPLGGISGIQKRIVYPEIAKRAGVEGKVLVLAFVDESGNVTKAEVIKGIGLGCDEAAINAIVQTKFKPGIQRGKPVKVQVTIPVTFKL